MRKWIDIINEKWLDTIRANGRQVDLFQNPTRSEWSKLFRDCPDGLRGHITNDGNLVVWDAMYATHADVDLGNKTPGYRYFYPDHIMFNDLHMDANEEDQPNAAGTIPKYDWFVTATYESTVANKSVTNFYGNNPKIIGTNGFSLHPETFEIDYDWIQTNCLDKENRW